MKTGIHILGPIPTLVKDLNTIVSIMVYGCPREGCDFEADTVMKIEKHLHAHSAALNMKNRSKAHTPATFKFK